MPVHFLIRHWKKELQVFYKNLFLLQKALSTEAVHDLRVSIKKLRSYSRLYSFVFANDKKERFPADLKKLFSVLGKQRNIEISIEWLRPFRKNQSLTGVEKHFKFYLNETTQRSISCLREYDPGRLKSLTIEIEQTVSIADPQKAEQDMMKLLKGSVAVTRSYLRSFSKNYHLARKKMKDVFYWSQILPGDFFFSPGEIKMLKKILDRLGNVQDQRVFVFNLKYQRKTGFAKGGTDYAEIKQIENKVNQKTKKLLEEAHGLTKELLNKK